MLEESIALANILPRTPTVLLKPRGEALDSNAFTARLRERQRSRCGIVIGGPDGLATLSEQADLHLAFGALTWPHQLVCTVAEQIYRATTICRAIRTIGNRCCRMDERPKSRFATRALPRRKRGRRRCMNRSRARRGG
jgi:hypothetical protein